jgi:histidine triad (HIT) family protein
MRGVVMGEYWPSMSDCAFCAIVSGDEPAHFVLDDDVAVAFLDRRPLFEGHVLVVPRRHVETLVALDAAEVGPLFERVRSVTAAVQSAMTADGSFVAMNNVVSQSVPHLHVHVVPRRRKDGLRGFFWPRTRYRDDAAMATVAASIARAIT